MPTHFREFTEASGSPGVLLIAEDFPIGKAVESLLLVWEATEMEEWENRLRLLPSLVTLVYGPPYRLD